MTEDAQSRWVRDVLKLPPDYFNGSRGSPVWLSVYIGALSGKARETKVFMEIWEHASLDDKAQIKIEAVLCLLEPDWRAREGMMEKAVKRWKGV